MNALHPNSEGFYRILVRLFLSNTDLDSWEVLKSALLEFVGMFTSETNGGCST